MKTVYLHGQLGKRFGEKWQIHARTVQEALFAIDANSEGFLQYILDSNQKGDPYFILKKDPKQVKCENELSSNIISDESLAFFGDNKEIHLIPCAQGAVVFTAIGAVAGLIAGAAGALASASLLTKIIVFGAIQLAMNALFKPPKPPTRKDPTNTKSFLIAGAQTRQAQGIAVPLGYGRLRVGPANVATRKTNKKVNSTKNSAVLEAYTELEFLDLICEGPIEGFVNKYGGAISGGDIREGIFLNDVQVKSTESGQFNYILNETEDSQLGMPKFKNGAENENQVLSDTVFSTIDYDTLLHGGGPYDKFKTARSHYEDISLAKKSGAKVISHFVSNKNVGELTFSLKCDLSIQNDDGSTSANNVRFAILVSRHDGEYNILQSKSGCSISYEEPRLTKVSAPGYNGYFSLSGIATSTYQFDINVKYDPKLNSSEISGGVTFKVIKLSAEYDPSVKGGTVGGIARTRSIQLSHIVESIKEKLLYPHSAMCRIMIDGKNFPNVPDRLYHLKLKKVLVPSNYDPVSRKYDGPWNGLFKGQSDSTQSIHEISDTNKYWSDNPAWVFFDLLHNPRYGIGKYGLEESNIDKWQLYKVAKYCDELVETSYPIETSSGKPREFVTSGDSLGFNSFEIHISGLSTSQFLEEFGEQFSLSGKKIAFFIYQHNYGSGDLSTSQKNTIANNSINRSGEIIIEERVIIRSFADAKKILVKGPLFSDNPAAFGSSRTVIGACCTQINHAVVEPRFTSNLFLTDRSEAMQIINSMASVFRGMVTYIGGKISVTQDSHKNPVQLFNNSNVINSKFDYSGVHKNKKVTAAMVRFNNKDKNFKPDLVYEEDAASMQSLGYIENETMGFGITSETQARRLAKWILLTSQLETETIKFVTGQEGSYLLPGSVFEVSDEARTNSDKSGRVLDVKLYRNRQIINENAETESVTVYDPYVLIDKDNISSPSYSRVEFTVYCATQNETLEDINRRSTFETSEDDQDAEIDSLRTPQIFRFEGSIYTDPSIDDFGPQGQKTIVSDLKLKLPIELNLAENTIKIYNHGLDDGHAVSFVTEGILPGGIKYSENGLPNYYIVNSTKHTFQISSQINGDPVNIFSVGKDRFENQGGLHYMVVSSGQEIEEALNQINLGASYSIKGLIAVPSVLTDMSIVERANMGIQGEAIEGVHNVKSDMFGFISVNNDWAFSYDLGWIYIKHLKERTDENYWFYVQDIGWIWTNETYKYTFWRVYKSYYNSSSNWIYVLYNNQNRDRINGFFAYDSSANTDPLNLGSNYRLGVNKNIPIKKISISSPTGYYISSQNNFTYYGQPAASSPVSVSLTSPNFKEAQISRIYPVDETVSVQGEDAIRVELQDGHGFILDRNGVVAISLTNTSVDEEWNIIKIEENVIELIGSASIANNFNDLLNTGLMSLEENISSNVDRFLEGQLFRTLGVKEISENKYEVTGLEYNYSKFFAVDSRGAVRSPVLPIPPQADMSIPEAPDGLVLLDLTV